MGRGSFLLSFLFSFSKKNFDSRKLIFHIPNFILKNIHNVDKSINQSIKKKQQQRQRQQKKFGTKNAKLLQRRISYNNHKIRFLCTHPS